MKEQVEAIKYDGFKKANFVSEWKAYFVLKARKKMYDMFIENMNPQKEDSILDGGVTPAKGIEGAKTITNNYLEQVYPYTERITATSIEESGKQLEKIFKGLTFVLTEPYNTPFKDREFDIVFCNAVVEHTGSRKQQKAFIYEYCRIGKKFFFTTPNRWFPIEPHSAIPLIHWLPSKWFRRILKLFGKQGLADEQILNLLTAKEFVSLFPRERVKLKLLYIKTLGITSNLIICGEWIDNGKEANDSTKT